MISLKDIEKIQNEWGTNLVKIGSLKNDLKVCEKETEEMIARLYGFESGNVLFKPTKAKDSQFRLNFEGAKSYFIGQNPNFSEDKGFALQALD
jgi:hypothetical protein